MSQGDKPVQNVRYPEDATLLLRTDEILQCTRLVRSCIVRLIKIKLVQVHQLHKSDALTGAHPPATEVMVSEFINSKYQ